MCHLAMPPTAIVAWSHVWPLVTHSVPTFDVDLFQNMLRFLQNASLQILKRCLSMMFVIVPWSSACRTLWSCWTDRSGRPRTLSQGRSQGSPDDVLKKFFMIVWLFFVFFFYFSLKYIFSSITLWKIFVIFKNSPNIFHWNRYFL